MIVKTGPVCKRKKRKGRFFHETRPPERRFRGFRASEDGAPGFGDDDQVLDPDAPEFGVVEPGLHGHDHPRGQLPARGREARLLVDFEPDAVPESLRGYYPLRGFYVDREITDPELLRSPLLLTTICGDLPALAPLYRYMAALPPVEDDEIVPPPLKQDLR